MEEIKKEFPKTVVPSHLEELFYGVISAYPELKNTYIFVHENKFYGIQHTLRAYPPMLSVLNKKENRVSPIVINTNKNIDVPFYSLSVDEQRGILAHELAHILDYTKKTYFELVIFSLKFASSKSFVRRIEKETDDSAIARGFGECLLKYKNNVSEKSARSYEQYRKVIYHGEEINGWRAFWFSFKHSLHTIVSFVVALFEMMELVYWRKIHKKSKD